MEATTETASIVIALIAAAGTVVASWIAHRAEKNTRPVANGFATDTTQRLARIETLIVNHLEDHAGHDLRKGKEA